MDKTMNRHNPQQVIDDFEDWLDEVIESMKHDFHLGK